jgi:hypothetical protein
MWVNGRVQSAIAQAAVGVGVSVETAGLGWRTMSAGFGPQESRPGGAWFRRRAVSMLFRGERGNTLDAP